jgi:hypothetical protein
MNFDLDMENRFASYNLDQFNQKAFELYEAEDHRDFIRFVVNGKIGDRQVVVDPIQHTLPHDQQISQLRDYDSVIGLAVDIEVQRSIFIYPVPNPRDTLTESLHLQYGVLNERNVSVGSITHTFVNLIVFFPGASQCTNT